MSEPGKTIFWLAAMAFAIGLALFWALRGTVPGRSAPTETDPDAPPHRRRDLAALLAVLGLLLIGVGAYVAGMVGIPWAVPIFVAGFALESWVGKANRRYRHASPSMRRIVRFVEGATTASLFAGVLIVGNVIAFRYGERPIDFTHEQVFSLESLTINQLKTLRRPVTFTAFFGNTPQSLQKLERVQQLLELFRAENPEMVKVDIVSLFRDQLRTEELIKKFPDVLMNAAGGVAIAYGEGETAEKLVVRNSELFEVQAIDPRRVESTFRGEDALTSALIRLREGKKARIAMTTGHGETPSVVTPSRASVSLLKARLEAQGASVADVDLTRGPIPDDISIALMIAPQATFSADDLGRLSAFLTRGGKLVLLLDGRAKTGLDAWLAGSNIEVGPGLIVDPRVPYLGNPAIVPTTVGSWGNHPVVSSLIGREIILAGAVPIAVKSPAANPGVRADAILATPPDTFAETDPATISRPVFDAAKDRRGPLTVGIAATDMPKTRGDEPSPRLVVYSSASVADDFFVKQRDANLDLVTNAVQWLRGRPDLQGIAPRRRDVLTFTADPSLQSRLVVLPTVLGLGLIVALGVMTYLSRRS